MWIKKYSKISELNSLLKNLPKKKKIVYTYGAFDLLHPGHIRLLVRAKELGDYLIVGIVSDNPIKNLKGKDRPIQKFDDRLTIVGSLRCVDAVIEQLDYDPSNELKKLNRVNILTKGNDWDYIPGTETIESMGGELILLNYTEKFSTSKIVKNIKKK